MALHPDFPESPHAILDPEVRWFPADEALRENTMDKHLYDVVGAKDKFDLMRFDSSGAVSAGMFDENWRRYVIKMATGSGKTKVMSLAQGL